MIGRLGAVLRNEESNLVEVFMWALSLATIGLAGIVGSMVGLGLQGSSQYGGGTRRRLRTVVTGVMALVVLTASVQIYSTVLGYDPSAPESASRIELDSCLLEVREAEDRVDRALSRYYSEYRGDGASGKPGEGPLTNVLRAEYEAAARGLAEVKGRCQAVREQTELEQARVDGIMRNSPGSRLPLFLVTLVVVGLTVVLSCIGFAFAWSRDSSAYGELDASGAESAPVAQSVELAAQTKGANRVDINATSNQIGRDPEPEGTGSRGSLRSSLWLKSGRGGRHRTSPEQPQRGSPES